MCTLSETRRSNELLREMQKHNIRMAIVVDDYGSVAGWSPSKIWEEIVGEIHDDTTNTRMSSVKRFVVCGEGEQDETD